MTAASIEYKSTGLQRISVFKDVFYPTGNIDKDAILQFVNLFCEYQLADNNYMNIHFEASLNKHNDNWFDSLALDQVLQLITYIIWTDKFLTGYMLSNIADGTMYRLLTRLEQLQ